MAVGRSNAAAGTTVTRGLIATDTHVAGPVIYTFQLAADLTAPL